MRDFQENNNSIFFGQLLFYLEKNALCVKNTLIIYISKIFYWVFVKKSLNWYKII